MIEPKMTAEEFVRQLKAIPLEQILATGDDDMRAKAMEALAQDLAKAVWYLTRLTGGRK